jgi:hypothetical protein
MYTIANYGCASMPFLYNCVGTATAESTEMSVSLDLRKKIVALHEKGATGYIVLKQLMLI